MNYLIIKGLITTGVPKEQYEDLEQVIYVLQRLKEGENGKI